MYLFSPLRVLYIPHRVPLLLVKWFFLNNRYQTCYLLRVAYIVDVTEEMTDFRAGPSHIACRKQYVRLHHWWDRPGSQHHASPSLCNLLRYEEQIGSICWPSDVRLDQWQSQLVEIPAVSNRQLVAIPAVSNRQWSSQLPISQWP